MKNKKIIITLTIVIAILGALLIKKNDESRYYQKLHNRQTWILSLQTDEESEALGKRISEHMDDKSATDEYLKNKYKQYGE
ncbi:hypothetical protein [Vagococcus fluvialis]|uniref:hypothetical protein n=1 Tax=Vagococcus fluvialis TaxID=2738 RepID=UPI001D0ABF68|nr:hypothetical protein [Vagococcus fluvialis]UDM72771.1 hypothetical protein K5L00_14550 [Vagococcus fluvialis]UDM78327.1 hypothetical protein K5K98_14755 [Vagococcus fluvialis]UDM84046.1 hypothetical protein K5K96_14575 [Vagococcus fluvialis]